MIKVNCLAFCLLLSQSFLSLFPTPLMQPSTRGTDLFVKRKNYSGSLRFFQDTTECGEDDKYDYYVLQVVPLEVRLNHLKCSDN
jgi:hypothetical protein